MIQTANLAAGERKEFREIGDFFRVMATTSGKVDVKFYRNGAEIADAPSVSAGYAEQFKIPFDNVAIISSVTQSVQFVTRQGSTVFYDTTPGGTLIFPPSQGSMNQATPAIGVAAGNILSARADRRFLLIQNNDASARIYISVNGSAATLTSGLQIGPGGSLELNAYCPTAAISALSTVATTNVVVLEA